MREIAIARGSFCRSQPRAIPATTQRSKSGADRGYDTLSPRGQPKQKTVLAVVDPTR